MAGTSSVVSKPGRGTVRRVTRGEIFSYSTLLHEALHCPRRRTHERKAECLRARRWPLERAMNRVNIPKAEADRLCSDRVRPLAGH